MRMLFVADLHYSLRQFDWLVANAEHFDLVMIGGDLLDLGSVLDMDVQIIVIERYLQRIRQKTRLLVCSGNHDGDSRNEADESYAQWLLDARAGGLFVDGETVAIGSVSVTACPWWDGPVSRAALEHLLATEASGRAPFWIWCHHAPPDGTKVCWSGTECVGDAALRQWIERFQPEIVLSGHVHHAPYYAEGSWIDQIGKTWVMNPGRQPGPYPATIVLDLVAMTAEWNSDEGGRSVRELAPSKG